MLTRKLFDIYNGSRFGNELQYEINEDDKIDSDNELIDIYKVWYKNELSENLYAIIPKTIATLDSKLLYYYSNNELSEEIVKPLVQCIIKHNNKEVFVLLYQKYPTLKKSLKKIDKYFVTKNLLIKVSNLHDLGCIHGTINLRNILIVDDKVMLKDCSYLPYGYDQEMLFETLERNLTEKIAKNVNFDADDYALGIVIMSMLAETHYESHNIIKTFKHGIFDFIFKHWFHNKIPEDDILLFYIGYCLIHKKLNKWQALEYLQRYESNVPYKKLKKKLVSLIDLDKKNHAIEIEITDNKFLSINEFYINIFLHFDEIKQKILNQNLVRNFLKNNALSTQFITSINILKDQINTLKKHNIREDLFVALFITILKPESPLKYNNIIANCETLGRYVFLQHIPSIKPYMYTFYTLMNNQFFLYYLLINKNIISNQQEIIKFYTTLNNKLANCNIKMFVIILFSYLNPSVPIQHIKLKNLILFSCADIIEFLNTVNKDEFDSIVNDEILLGLLLGKLYHFHSLKENTTLEYDFFYGLAMVQKKLNIISLQNLNYLIFTQLKANYLTEIKKKQLKKDITLKLEENIKFGSILKMLKIAYSKKIQDNQKKYNFVLKRLKKLRSEKNAMLNSKISLQNTLPNGLLISVICFIIIIIFKIL